MHRCPMSAKLLTSGRAAGSPYNMNYTSSYVIPGVNASFQAHHQGELGKEVAGLTLERSPHEWLSREKLRHFNTNSSLCPSVG